MPGLSPELHSYLAAAIRCFNDKNRCDPRWLDDKARIERIPPDRRGRRDNALLTADMIAERLFEEALEYLERNRLEPERESAVSA